MLKFMQRSFVMAAALLATAGSAWAAPVVPTINFDDTAVTFPDTITVTTTGFNSFTLGGKSGKKFTIAEAGVAQTFSGKWDAVVVPTTAPVEVFLLESTGVGPNRRALISDIFRFSISTILGQTGKPVGSQIEGSFNSDDPDGRGYIRELGPNETGIVEDGKPVTVPYQGINIVLASDLNAPDPTPEPASMILMAVGIAGMAGYGWRRRKQA